MARANRYDDAFALLGLNEQVFPGASSTQLFHGNINLLRGDTAAAVASYREAVRRDSTNREALVRLRDLGHRP